METIFHGTINKHVDLNWFTKPMCRSFAEQTMETVQGLTKKLIKKLVK